jgi:hypothetical protein
VGLAPISKLEIARAEKHMRWLVVDKRGLYQPERVNADTEAEAIEVALVLHLGPLNKVIDKVVDALRRDLVAEPELPALAINW